MISTARISIDLRTWPLAVITYQGSPTPDELAEHLREIEQTILARRERFALVIDQAGGEMPTPKQRALIAQHQKAQELAYSRYCLGEAYVVSPKIRGAMVAVFWQAAPSYPYVFVETRAEAMRWAREKIATASDPATLGGAAVKR